MISLASVLQSLKNLIDEEFECPICLHPCTDTYLNPECNHRFCANCMKQCLRKCNHECPSCRVSIPTFRTCRKDTHFDRILQRLVEEFIEPMEHHVQEEQRRSSDRKKNLRGTKVASVSMKIEGGSLNSSESKIKIKRKAPPLDREREDVHVQPPRKHMKSSIPERSNLNANHNPMNEISSYVNSDDSTNPTLITPTRSSERKQVSPAIIQNRKKRKKRMTFDEHFEELVAFKKAHGHINVGSNQSLNRWFISVRGKRRAGLLSAENIIRLSSIGFKWSKKIHTFDERFWELMAFKAVHGHCNVPESGSTDEYDSLGKWCNQMRLFRRKKDMDDNRGVPLHYRLTEDNIERLTTTGFKWNKRRCSYSHMANG